MTAQTPHNTTGEETSPENGTENNAATEDNSDLLRDMTKKFHDESMPAVIPKIGVPDSQSNFLSDAEREALFAELRVTLGRIENCPDAPATDIIEAALMKNPALMCHLKRLQDAGAELVVTGFQQDQYVELADAALNLDVEKQEAGLAGLTEQQRNAAIETILDTIPADQRDPARKWIVSQINRPDDPKGLNYAEALVYAVAHGGTLISQKVYDEMAKRDPKGFEKVSNTWCFTKLSYVMEVGTAWYAFRYFDWAYPEERDAQYRGLAQYRYGNYGARVAVRVQL